MLDIDAANAVLATKSPADIVAWAAGEFGDALVMSSSFGAESTLLIHMATRVSPSIPVIFIDTGFLFRETYDFVETLRTRFNLNLLRYGPHHDVNEFLKRVGEPDATWRSDVEGCCAVNKNEPFERAMRQLRPRGWLRGIRRDQADTRRARQIVECSKRFDCYAISPLLNWSSREIHDYMKEHDLPYHPLREQGYASIGCSPLSCTRPIHVGEDSRAGRWSGQAKVECGLHLEK